VVFKKHWTPLTFIVWTKINFSKYFLQTPVIEVYKDMKVGELFLQMSLKYLVDNIQVEI